MPVIVLTIYADILWLVNFIMNGFVLWVLSKLARTPRKARWILAGAGIMAFMYTLLIIFEPLRFINIALASVAILAVGVALAFHPRGIRPFVKLMITAYVISFTIGGVGMALFFLTDLPYALYFIAADWDGFARTVSWQLALVGMAVSYIIIKLILRLLERHTLKRQLLCNVQVFIGEQDCSFDALVDTGHSLKEPISQSPVIIAEFELIKTFLPDGLKVLFYEKQENDLLQFISSREESFYNRIRMVPFTSIGRNNGMLIGFRPDRVKVQGGKDTPPDVVIGIYNDTLCRDGRYRGLLSPELVA